MTDLTPRIEPGWVGAFSRNEAEGAFPNGTRIYKARMEKGDATPIGIRGVVLGSWPVPSEQGKVHSLPDPDYEVRHIYFVEWDDKPRVAVGMIDWKIEKLLPSKAD